MLSSGYASRDLQLQLSVAARIGIRKSLGISYTFVRAQLDIRVRPEGVPPPRGLCGCPNAPPFLVPQAGSFDFLSTERLASFSSWFSTTLSGPSDRRPSEAGASRTG